MRQTLGLFQTWRSKTRTQKRHRVSLDRDAALERDLALDAKCVNRPNAKHYHRVRID